MHLSVRETGSTLLALIAVLQSLRLIMWQTLAGSQIGWLWDVSAEQLLLQNLTLVRWETQECQMRTGVVTLYDR